MNHKAQFDLIVIIITIIIIALLSLIVITVNSIISNLYKERINNNNSTAYKAIDKAESIFRNGMDSLFLGIFILLLLGMIILAFYIQSSVLFLIIFIIISVISTWFAAIISNIYMKVGATGVFATALSYVPIQNFIIENLPIFNAGFAMILLIVTYSKDIFFQRVGIEG